jgi:zinc transport system substrate-binding protein
MAAMKSFLPVLSVLMLLLAAPAQAQEKGDVVVSIKPLHSLVAAVMGRTGEPGLLVGGLKSPHGYQLAPSQVTELQHAKLIFYIGPGLETFLARPLATVGPEVHKIAMIEAPGIRLLQPRSGGLWEQDEDEDHAGGPDPHIWLDIGNAKAMVQEIEKQLSAAFPQRAQIYKTNAAGEMAKLDLLDRQLKIQLAAFRSRPFIVFHDAFQYFEHGYRLKGAGAITLEPEQEPGAKRIALIRGKIKAAGVSCVFSEPQFNARLAETVTEGTSAKVGVLDEHGAAYKPGPDLYFQLMSALEAGFRNCLH